MNARPYTGAQVSKPAGSQISKSACRGHAPGFSLIEVMVAILILGIALTGLVHGITTALASSKESEWQTTAALFAAGRIETLRAEGDLEDGETDGDCGAGLAAYHWRQTVSSTDISGLHEVAVVVEKTQSGEEIFALKTMLFEPDSDSTAKGAKPKSKKGNAS